ncbi:MAG: carboxypeptidase-like regulatory domain-containing protein, partial [Acidobacteriota bacterium]
MRSNGNWRATLLWMALEAGAPLFGQTGLATLTGTVTDPSGAILANVTVSALHVDTGTVLGGATSSTGSYTIAQMPIGRYSITVESG